MSEFFEMVFVFSSNLSRFVCYTGNSMFADAGALFVGQKYVPCIRNRNMYHLDGEAPLFNQYKSIQSVKSEDKIRANGIAFIKFGNLIT